MDKEKLIEDIRRAFNGVKLEDSVGLWEGQGLDDYADDETILKLRRKDERDDWSKISNADLCDCNNAVSYLDAKGMRFHLPKLLIYHLLFDDFLSAGEFEKNDPPSVIFALTYNLTQNYNKEKFSLLTSEQISCIIQVLENEIKKTQDSYLEYGIEDTSLIDSKEYPEMIEALAIWKDWMNDR